MSYYHITYKNLLVSVNIESKEEANLIRTQYSKDNCIFEYEVSVGYSSSKILSTHHLAIQSYWRKVEAKFKSR